jgi:hypothetical protein
MKRIALTILTLMAIAIQSRAAYWTPTQTPTPNATWTAIAATATYVASSYTLTPTPVNTPTITPVYTPTTIFTPHPVQNNVVPNFSWRPPTRVDYLLPPNTSWTAITSNPCQLQPCIAELSIPETSAITWRYWRGSASATPTVPGDPALPADVIYPLALNPNETLWYKAVGATTISGSAQVSQ